MRSLLLDGRSFCPGMEEFLKDAEGYVPESNWWTLTKGPAHLEIKSS